MIQYEQSFPYHQVVGISEMCMVLKPRIFLQYLMYDINEKCENCGNLRSIGV